MSDATQTTPKAGDKVQFTNGGEVVVHWVTPNELGFSVWHPDWTDHRLLRMTSEDFAASIRLSQEAINGNDR